MKKSLLFDLDGTLWDPINMIIESWDLVMKVHGLPKVEGLKEKLPSTLGTPSSEFGPLLLPGLSQKKVDTLINETCLMECEVIRKKGGVLYRGVKETLQVLSIKYDLYIVSNCQQDYIEAFLDYYTELKPLIKDWECFGNTGEPKGENIRRVIERNQLSPVAFVGDKDSDRDGAHENNLPFVWAAYGFGEKIEGWAWKIDSVKELEKIFL